MSNVVNEYHLDWQVVQREPSYVWRKDNITIKRIGNGEYIAQIIDGRRITSVINCGLEDMKRRLVKMGYF